MWDYPVTENTQRVTLVFLTNKRPKESQMLNPISSVNRISSLLESSINLLLGTRSVKRLKMKEHAPHTTRVSACPASSGQAAFRRCSERALCSGISRIKRTYIKEAPSEPPADLGVLKGQLPAAGTGQGQGQRPGLPAPHRLPPPAPLGRSATGRRRAGERDGQRKPRGRKVERFVCCHPFSIRKSTSLLEARINKGGM